MSPCEMRSFPGESLARTWRCGQCKHSISQLSYSTPNRQIQSASPFVFIGLMILEIKCFSSLHTHSIACRCWPPIWPPFISINVLGHMTSMFWSIVFHKPVMTFWKVSIKKSRRDPLRCSHIVGHQSSDQRHRYCSAPFLNVAVQACTLRAYLAWGFRTRSFLILTFMVWAWPVN